MEPAEDSVLLRRYVESDSNEAFAALVARHINLVYSVALRQVGNPHQAEEISQAVFIILAKKAAQLRHDKALSSWLFQTTRLTANNFSRSETRRHRREEEAYMQSVLSEANGGTWLRIAPLLDDAVAGLREQDRRAIMLRFYEGRNLREVGLALGAGEDAAEKRISRALEKLRSFFSKRGVHLTIPIIAGVISANSVQAAPTTLGAYVATVAAAKGVAASGSTLTLIKGTLKLMAWTKFKTGAAIGMALIVGTSAVVVTEKYFPSEPSYQGRRLSEWLVDVNYDQPKDKRGKAKEAIQKMGSKTVPFLLSYFTDDKSTNKDESMCRATWGFDALGPVGKPAIPKLKSLMGTYPGYVPSALAGIGKDALPDLLTALTNENFWIRDNTAAAIANAIFQEKISSADASGAFPVALNNLSYENTNKMYEVNTRSRAVWLLAALRMSSDISVPALIKELEYTNPSVVEDSAWALSEFGQQARPAIPFLIKAAGSTNDQISAYAKRALETIQKSR